MLAGNMISISLQKLAGKKNSMVSSLAVRSGSFFLRQFEFETDLLIIQKHIYLRKLSLIQRKIALAD